MSKKLKILPLLLVLILPIIGSVFFSPIATAGSAKLSYYPTYYNFGDVGKGKTDFIKFSIWNNGGCSCDVLYYTLSEGCSWLDITPSNGSSTGEHDPIIVSIDTTGLSSGPHRCVISINTNDKSGTFTVTINVAKTKPFLNSFLFFFERFFERFPWLEQFISL